MNILLIRTKFFFLIALGISVLCRSFVNGQVSENSLRDSVEVKQPLPYQLGDINYALERTEQTCNLYEEELGPDPSIERINTLFQVMVEEMHQEFISFNDFRNRRFSRFYLENTYFFWQDYSIKLHDLQDDVNAGIRENQKLTHDLNRMLQKWENTLESQEISDQPEVFRHRITAVTDKVRQLKADFEVKTNLLINLEIRIAQQVSSCNSMIDGVIQAQEEIRQKFFVSESLPLWVTHIERSDYAPVGQKFKEFWDDTSKYIKVYMRSERAHWVIGFFLGCAFLIWIIRLSFSRYAMDRSIALQRSEVINNVLFNYPFISVMTIFLANFPMFFPNHPTLINKLTKVFLFISVNYLIPDGHNRQRNVFLFKLTFLLVLNYVQVLFWYFGSLARYFILLESILGIVFMFPYLKLALWNNIPAEDKIFQKIISYAPLIVFGFYFISFFTNLFGLFNLTHYLIKAGIHIPVMAIILYGLYMVWKGLTGAILQISQSFKEYYISHYWEKLERRFTRIVLVVIILFWLYYIALLFEVDKPLLAWLTEFLIRERSVGTLEISVSSILTFLGILAVTFFFTGVIRFIIDDEFISKSKLPRGLAAAISATLRYVIIILGVMFALSAAGIDLGKFSLIAGALGLGIGFGLQNLVNNFISGLILVYERPIQVGDTIEIESLLGRVKKIGLRSSQVITYDGAEVVVPNGNLISNQLINWTLSNKQRRIKIQVGASYGSDPNVVLRLLEEVANSHSNILKDPPPLAVFDGFGESSLDFTLLFWVPFDLGILTKSQVSVAIYSVFKANGIEIPFPQLDLHVKEKNSGKLTES